MGLNAQVQRVVVSELRGDTFYAVIWMEQKLVKLWRSTQGLRTPWLSLCAPTAQSSWPKKYCTRPRCCPMPPKLSPTEHDVRKWLENLGDEDLGKYKM